MDKEKTLFNLFCHGIEAAIDANGVYPHHCCLIDKDGSNMMAMMAVPEPELVGVFAIRKINEGARELVFGLDRFTEAGQGTEFGDLISFYHFHNGEWHVGIIEYQFDKNTGQKTVKPPNFDNEFWNELMHKELDRLKESEPDCAIDFNDHMFTTKNSEEMAKKLAELSNISKEFESNECEEDSEGNGAWGQLSDAMTGAGKTKVPEEEQIRALDGIFDKVDENMKTHRPDCIPIRRIVELYKGGKAWSSTEEAHILSGCKFCTPLKNLLHLGKK